MKKQVDYRKIELTAQRRSDAFKVVAYVFLGFLLPSLVIICSFYHSHLTPVLPASS